MEKNWTRILIKVILTLQGALFFIRPVEIALINRLFSCFSHLEKFRHILTYFDILI